jgi:hypothetical protein
MGPTPGTESRRDFSNGLLHQITTYLLPTAQIWTDPFGGLMGLGQTLINGVRRRRRLPAMW